MITCHFLPTTCKENKKKSDLKKKIKILFQEIIYEFINVFITRLVFKPIVTICRNNEHPLRNCANIYAYLFEIKIILCFIKITTNDV